MIAMKSDHSFGQHSVIATTTTTIWRFAQGLICHYHSRFINGHLLRELFLSILLRFALRRFFWTLVDFSDRNFTNSVRSD